MRREDEGARSAGVEHVLASPSDAPCFPKCAGSEAADDVEGRRDSKMCLQDRQLFPESNLKDAVRRYSTPVITSHPHGLMCIVHSAGCSFGAMRLQA